MKTNLRSPALRPVRGFATFLASAAFLALSHVAGTAAPLTATTAVHTKPDDASPAVTFLKAGTDPLPVAGTIASTPAGWMAVELPGPFEAYVRDSDLTKSLDVKPGASIYLAPKAEGGVLALAEKDDKTNITGQRGRWIQIRFERKLTGYINLGGTPGYLPPIATTPASTTPTDAAPMSAAPVAPIAYGSVGIGHAAAAVNPSDSSAALPRQFSGKLASTRSPFRPRRPFDWALNDDAGKRYAYLDISKLLLTQQIEAYTDHAVVVFGAARPGPDGKDLVIYAESLQLK
ncbi:MAG: hypothetical protein EXS32_17610 [Opitutus sp.]|nr:hypothetical protein [Opitutus sp.]